MREQTILTVLADPTRQVVLQLLRHKPLPVGELAARLPISRPAVSQHLRTLKKAQLVREHRLGTRHYFSLDPAGFAQARAYIDNLWKDALNAFSAYVEEQESFKQRKTRKE